MAWIAVDKDGTEFIFEDCPVRYTEIWWPRLIPSNGGTIQLYAKLPKGSIKKLIGRELTWEDEPVEIMGTILEYKMKELKAKLKCRQNRYSTS